jgi:formiminotetrahydrofolate cyclodeaminase
MAALVSRQVGEALVALASREQPPAAGLALALTAAAAAALVELSAGLAAKRLALEASGGEAAGVARMRALSERAAELRARLLAAADEDVAAYSEVAGADDPAGRARALAGATGPPLLIAESASEVAEAAAETVAAGDWDFRADAVVAGELAAAAALGSAELVAANLSGDPEDPRTDRARAAADRARRAGGATARPARG